MNEKWKEVTLGEIADVIDPHPSHRAPPVIENGFPFAGIGDISEDGFIDVPKCRKIAEDTVTFQENAYSINNNSIGFGRVGTVGKVLKLRKQNFRYALSPTLSVINPKNNINPKLVYHLLRSKQTIEQVQEQIKEQSTPENIDVEKSKTVGETK